MERDLFAEDVKNFRTATVREMLCGKLGVERSSVQHLSTDELIRRLAQNGRAVAERVSACCR